MAAACAGGRRGPEVNMRDGLPIPAGADVDNFRIFSAPEIIGLLRDMVARHVLLTVHFNEGRESLVTMLLEVNPEFEEVVFDRGAGPDANRHLLRASRLTFVTTLDHIKIQFQVLRAYETMHGGEPAFRMRIPASILRLQRRNSYRVKLPQSHPVLCHVPRPKAEPLRIRVLDLSVEGVALMADGGTLEANEGDILRGCRIDLPEHRLQVDLEVRNTLPLDALTLPKRRFGCRFVKLPASEAAMISRVILAIERAQHR